MREGLKKVWPYLFTGLLLFYYIILYFPQEDEDIIVSKILLDIVKSILMTLLSFIGFFIIIYIDERLNK